LTLTASNGRSLTSSNAAEVAYLSRRGVVDLHLGKSSEMRIGLVSANPGLPLRLSPVTFRHKVIAAELQTGLWSAAKARVQGRALAWCGGSRHWHRGGHGWHRTGEAFT
jgi:hypothetical protein